MTDLAGRAINLDTTAGASRGLVAAPSTAAKLRAVITSATLLVGSGSKKITAKLSAPLDSATSACKTAVKIGTVSMDAADNACDVQAGDLTTMVFTIASSTAGYTAAVLGEYNNSAALVNVTT